MADHNRERFAAWLRRAEKRGYAASVIERLRLRLRRRGSDPWVHMQLGIAYCEMSRFPEALHHLARAWRKAPAKGKASIARWIGETYQDLGRIDRAIRWFECSIRHDPRDATVFVFYGAMLSRLGRLDEAETVFHRATRCETGAIDETYLNLGLIHRGRENYKESEAMLQMALALTPRYREAIRALRDVRKAMRIAAKA